MVEISRSDVLGLAREVGLCALLGITVLTAPPYLGGALGVCIGLAVVAVAVFTSRRFPLIALLFLAAATLIDDPSLFSKAFSWPLLVISYLVGERMANERPAQYGFVAIFAVGTGAGLIVGDVYLWFTMVICLVLTVIFPWLVGRYRRQYRELVTAGWERADQLERQQQVVADKERLRERARIAGDMHDSLGHELSLLALRAGALELEAGLTLAQREAAAQVRASAAAATDRLAEIIGVLREGDSAAPLEPVSATIDELVDRAVNSGMTIRFEQSPATELLPEMIDRAAYRVVQEALTNATKHAPDAPVAVQIGHHNGETVVEVRSPLPAAPTMASGAGVGLVGLRERVRLVGGDFEAGPVFGEFRVWARLPHHAVTVPAQQDTSESEKRLSAARGQVRRRLVTAITVPIAMVLVLVVIYVAYYAYAVFASTLAPADYRSFQVGQRQSEVEQLLPRREYRERAALKGPSRPPGSDCRYYRSTGNPFADELLVYRLCFADGVLVAKDAAEEGRDTVSDTSRDAGTF